MNYRRVSHLAWRRVVAETVVIDLHERRVLGVNDTGAWILEQLAEPRAAETLARVSCEAGGDVAAHTADVARFLEELARAGVVEASPAAGGAEPGACPDTLAGIPPAVLWQEKLEAVVHVSPSQDVGDLDCQ